jgi:hypothetical protein
LTVTSVLAAVGMLAGSLLVAGAPKGASAGAFEFVETGEGLELRVDARPVLFYQRETRSLDGRLPRSNYIHPLMSLDGDVLTEDFPEDHPHHRGVFWAWHQLFVGDERVGDGWLLEDFATEVTATESRIAAGSARIHTTVRWSSPRHREGKPFIEERTTLTVYRATPDTRAIDFEIALRALVPGVRIGGSEDAKGYGGFSPRLRLPQGLKFTGRGGEVAPQTLQIEAGPWMDLSGPYGANGAVSGLTILTHPSSPGFPQPWILRQQRSMQNVVFPGRGLIDVPTEEPLVLRYRLVIHRGAAAPGDVEVWQQEYGKQSGAPGPGPE